VVDASVLPTIEYEQAFDIHGEFFRRHSNGSEAAKGIFAVKLNEIQISKQLHRIRMSSYRWLDVNGVPPCGTKYPIPRNYAWFLEMIRRDGQIGWMDFIAGVGVNCNTAEVISYMGGLYARAHTVGAWMYDIEALDEAMYRGWIYQETAFGALDEGGCRNLISLVRDSFIAVRDGEKDQNALASLFRATSVFGKLIHRRGFELWRDRNPLFESFTFARYGHGFWVQTMWNIVAPRIGLTSGSPLRVTGNDGGVAGEDDSSCEYATVGSREKFSGTAAWANPECAETELKNPSDLQGKVAIVRRGEVTFMEKAERVAKAGAIAVVIVNTQDFAFVIHGAGHSSLSIPIVSVSSSVGAKLLNGVTVAASPRTGLNLRESFEQSLRYLIRSITPLVCLDVFTMDDEPFAAHAEELCSFLTSPSYTLANTAKDFGEIFGGSIVHAFLEAALTYEEDREAAICSVASYIYRENLNHTVSTREMLNEAWCGLYRIDTKNLSNPGHCIMTTCPNVKSRTLGLGEHIFGAKVVDNDSYAAADTGKLVKLPGTPGLCMQNLNQIVGAYKGNNTYALPSSSNTGAGGDSEGELLELFICEPPSHLQAIAGARSHEGSETAAVLFVTRRLNGPATGNTWSVLNWIQNSDMTGDPNCVFQGPLRMPAREAEFE